VRTDSDALFHQFGVRLRRVLDVQLSEVALRKEANGSTHRLKGLGACLDTYLPATNTQKSSEIKVREISPPPVKTGASELAGSQDGV
jgi:hypothetical protein